MSNTTEIRVPQARYSLLNTDRKGCLYRNKFILTGLILTTLSFFMLAIYVAMVGIYDQVLYPKHASKKELSTQWLHRAIFYNSLDYAQENQPQGELPNNVKSSTVDSFKLICYYSLPNDELLERNHSGILLPYNIDPSLCTHINLAFASVVNNSISLSESQKNAAKTILDLRKENQNLKVLLSIGGAGDVEGFAEMVLNHENRKTFIKSIDFYVRHYKFDGIDLDWEFPNEIIDEDKKQKQHFTQLLYEIRKEIDRQDRHKFLLSVAVAAPPFLVDNCYDVEYMNKYVDYINLMSYDYHFYTKSTPFTGYNAPLYPVPNEVGYFGHMNINYSATYWNSKGMDKSKIIIGLPTFGHSFKLLNPHNNGLKAPVTGYGKLGRNGFIDYNDVCWFLTKNKITPIFDLETKSPYATKYYEWISYDDQNSLTFKAEYIKNNNFGGAMILSLNTDDHQGYCKLDGKGVKFPLTNRIKTVLNDQQL